MCVHIMCTCIYTCVSIRIQTIHVYTHVLGCTTILQYAPYKCLLYSGKISRGLTFAIFAIWPNSQNVSSQNVLPKWDKASFVQNCKIVAAQSLNLKEIVKFSSVNFFRHTVCQNCIPHMYMGMYAHTPCRWPCCVGLQDWGRQP